MPAETNIFKQRLRDNQTQFGCWLGMANAYCAEMASTANFDWLLIDAEHAPNDLRSTLGQLQALRGSNSQALVRLPIGEIWQIKQLLDAGAQSLLIPMVESAEQAQALIQATRYPPKGVRGVGSALARASQFGAISDYLSTADEQICLLLQIESRAGVAALDDILALEDVDGIFVGPSDLAADMGYLGKPQAPEVREAVFDVLQRTRAAGKAAGILALDLDFAAECLEAGASFVATGIDVTCFTKSMRQLAAQSKALLNHD